MLRADFILNEGSETVGEYVVQRGEYVDCAVFPQFNLALFIPSDPDRAESGWVLVAWTHERSWFRTLRSFIMAKSGRDLEFYFGRNFPMDSERGLPDIGQLGRFEGDTWEPNEEILK